MRTLTLLLAAIVALAGESASSQQPSATRGALLASVSMPQPVLANGQPLAAGPYQLRFTGEWFQPLEQGGQQGMQWVEFVSDGRVAGRELALVIPASEIGEISQWHPPAGATRVDVLKTGDFVRIWSNQGGTNYLIHLPVR